MPQYDTKSEVERSKNIYRNLYKDTTQRFNGTWQLLWLWKGSCFKLIWHDFAFFIAVYASISALYRNVLFYYPEKRQLFELICVYADRFSSLIPITFLTGFYVSQVVSRWWDQFISLPWPDKLALKLVSFCPGTDHFNKNLRRTVMRYVNLSSVLVYRLVSKKVMCRFPDYQSLVDAKLMLPHEVSRLEKADEKTPHESTWTPILWAMKLLTRARIEGKITVEAPIFANLQSSFEQIETSNRKILCYGWVNFPLAYTQVATLSVFTYFLAALFGRQYLIPSDKGMDREMFPNLTIAYSSTLPFRGHTPDFYIPFFTLAELFCYMGWIKVAETLLNPFGDDDEDFQINYLIDRNLQVSYMIVDDADREVEMADDPFLEAGIDIPKELPYKKSVKIRISRSISNNVEPGDLDSMAGSVSSNIQRSYKDSLSILNLTRFKAFRRKKAVASTGAYGPALVGGRHHQHALDVPPRVNSQIMSESMPPMKPPEQPFQPQTSSVQKHHRHHHDPSMAPIPGSNSDDEEAKEAGGAAISLPKSPMLPMLNDGVMLTVNSTTGEMNNAFAPDDHYTLPAQAMPYLITNECRI